MIQFTKTSAMNLEKVFQNAQNQTVSEPVADGTLITIYTKDLISKGGGTDLIWQIPFELWFGDVADRDTAQGERISPEPFSTGFFSWKVLDDLGNPTYPITRSDNANDVIAAVIDANQRCIELIAALTDGLEASNCAIVGI
jgi:hypothetical protein